MAIGLAHGLGGAWLIDVLSDWIFGFRGPTSVYGFLRVALLVAVLFLTPAIAFAMLITRVHPRFWRTILCGVFYGPCVSAGIFAVVIAEHPQILLFEQSQSQGVFLWLSILMVAAIYGAIVSGAVCACFAFGFGVEHLIGRRVLTQTGAICWACGYDLGVPDARVCSECGKQFDPAARPRSGSPILLGVLAKARWPLFTLSLLVALCPVVYDLVTTVIPATRFLNARPTGWALKDASMIGTYVWRTGSPGNCIRPISDGWWLPDPGSSAVGTIVQFLPDARAGEPRIVVSRANEFEFSIPSAAVIAGTPDPVKSLGPGSTHILARLSADQAAQVIATRSIPQGLIDALREQAESEGWTQTDPMKTPSSGEKTVDPSPYFKAASIPGK
jgi:hypothetical protein